MVLASKMDEIGGRGGWIAAMVLGFCLYWPLGLAILAYLIFSGRFRSFRQCGPGRWHNTPDGRPAQQSGCNWNWGGRSGTARPSGNQAFDEYRTETLKRLEDEQREFEAYLERLRQARDKAEFDQFMAERRRRNGTPPEPLPEA
ncbi:MAG: DUF2852 domain-containing protein [Alphaproteobacteria bacterium]|nr:DUF2852 domain-containing protein [Alphaproteobacteria bacterium]